MLDLLPEDKARLCLLAEGCNGCTSCACCAGTACGRTEALGMNRAGAKVGDRVQVAPLGLGLWRWLLLLLLPPALLALFLCLSSLLRVVEAATVLASVIAFLAGAGFSRLAYARWRRCDLSWTVLEVI